MIVLTRPLASASSTLLLWQSEGLVFHHYPMVELQQIEVIEPIWHSYEGIFFSSPKVLQFIPAAWLEKLQEYRLRFAVGEATAKQFSFEVQSFAHYSSLQEVIPILPSCKRWLHLCSSETKMNPEDWNISWDNIPVYKPAYPTTSINPNRISKTATLVFFSGSAAKFFFDNFSDRTHHYICVGESSRTVVENLSLPLKYFPFSNHEQKLVAYLKETSL